jgi:hypothetical protein
MVTAPGPEAETGIMTNTEPAVMQHISRTRPEQRHFDPIPVDSVDRWLFQTPNPAYPNISIGLAASDIIEPGAVKGAHSLPGLICIRPTLLNNMQFSRRLSDVSIGDGTPADEVLINLTHILLHEITHALALSEFLPPLCSLSQRQVRSPLLTCLSGSRRLCVPVLRLQSSCS